MRRLTAILIWTLVFLWLVIMAMAFTGFKAHAAPPEPVPAIYALFDYGTDFATTRPDAGPIGAVHQHAWEDINPAEGVYNWTPIDEALAKEEGLTVTLADGRVVPKPVLLLIVSHYSSSSKGAWADAPSQGIFFYDATPGWVYSGIPHEQILGKSVGHILVSGSLQAVLPAYDQAYWRQQWLAMVEALGKHYDGHPQIACVTVSTGMDTETHPVKTWLGVEWAVVLREQASAVEYRFGQFVPEVLAAYDAAFPITALTLPQIPGARMHWADLAAEYGGHIGLHPAGVQPDTEAYKGYGKYDGLWDPIEVYSGTLPIFPESAHDGDAGFRYWSLFMAAHNKPVAVSLHKPMMSGISDAHLRWLNDQLGKETADLDAVWAVMRDLEYPFVGSTYMGASGKVGDWGRGIERQSVAVRVETKDIPAAQKDVRSRQCRRIDGTMALTIDASWSACHNGPYELRVTYLDYAPAGKLEIWWRQASGERQSLHLTKGGLDAWVTVRIPIEDIDTTRGVYISNASDGDAEYIHRIEMEDIGEQSATPTATGTADPTATRTATPSPSRTETATRTRDATEVPTRSPTATRAATPYAVTAEIRVAPGSTLYVDGQSIPVVDGLAFAKVGPIGASVGFRLYPPLGMYCGAIEAPSFLRFEQDGCSACIAIPAIPFSIVWPSVDVQATPTPRRYLVELYWDDTAKWRPYHSLALPLIERGK